MKKIIFTLILLLNALATFSNELPYEVHYQDRGPVIKHATCQLLVKKSSRNYYEKYLDDELVTVLSNKGYQAYDDQTKLKVNNELKTPTLGDLVLNIETLHKKRTHIQIASFGYISYVDSQNRDSIEINKIDEIPSYQSSKFKMNPKRGEYVEYEVLTLVKGEPFSIGTRKGKNSLIELYQKLPDCIAQDSAHHYERNKYNETFIYYEISVCRKRYLDRISQIESNYFSFNSSYLARLKDSVQFIDNISKCYQLIEEGKMCDFIPDFETRLEGLSPAFKSQINGIKNLIGEEDAVSILGDYNLMTQALRTSAVKKITALLEIMTKEELTIKVADYLGTSRICSLDEGNTRAIYIDALLKKFRSSL